VRVATRDPDVRLYPTDRTADWLLWRIPDLRGRVAYDVRFELYGADELDRIFGYERRDTGGPAVVDDFEVIVVDDRAHLSTLNAEPGTKLAYEDDEIAVVTRNRPST
jgi:hypothetical protein